MRVSSGDDPFGSRMVSEAKGAGHGTGLSVLVERNLPDPNRIRELLASRFLHDPKFEVTVNGTSLPFTELPGFSGKQELIAVDPVSLGFNRESFYRAGVSLILTETCPLCDHEWDPDKLRQHLAAKLKHLETLSARRKVAQKKLTPIIALMRSAQTTIHAVVRAAELAKPPLPAEAAREFIASCRAREHSRTR